MPKTRSLRLAEALQRAATAREHLQVALERLEYAEKKGDRSETAQVAASNAILAGIAAADAICGKSLGQCSSDPDHQAANALLQTVPNVGNLPAKLGRLLADKSNIQYGGFCSVGKARESVAQAQGLVDALDHFDL